VQAAPGQGRGQRLGLGPVASQHKGAGPRRKSGPDIAKPIVTEEKADRPEAAPQAMPEVRQANRRALPADWLPLALLAGDVVISALSVPFGYWVRYVNAGQALPFGPYLAAIPVVVVMFAVAL